LKNAVRFGSMNSFKYIARDPSGVKKQGIRQAGSANDALGWLREQSLTPVLVKEISVDIDKSNRKSSRWRRCIKSSDLSAFCWQMMTMVEGGIPVTTALDTISQEMENRQLRQVLRRILQKMQKGQAFSECISEYPKVFNRLCCAIILAGETSGDLADALLRLATYFDNRDRLSRKIKSAMAYPAFAFGVIVLIVIFIMAFIVPRFRTIFDQMGGEMPAVTQAFMSLYDVLGHNIIYIIAFVVVMAVSGILVCSKTRKGHYLFSKITLGIPLLGKVFSQAFLAIFCRTMSTLLAAGVSVLDVFNILSAMAGNDIIRDAIIKTRERIIEGSNISGSMSTTGFFPNSVVKMIEVGEGSGSLSKVLDKTADYYERRVDSTIGTVVSLLEPVMIVIVGAIVTVVVVALYLPIFSMSDI